MGEKSAGIDDGYSCCGRDEKFRSALEDCFGDAMDFWETRVALSNGRISAEKGVIHPASLRLHIGEGIGIGFHFRHHVSGAVRVYPKPRCRRGHYALHVVYICGIALLAEEGSSEFGVSFL